LCSFCLNRPTFCFSWFLASSGNASNIVRLTHILTQSFSIQRLYLSFHISLVLNEASRLASARSFVNCYRHKMWAVRSPWRYRFLKEVLRWSYKEQVRNVSLIISTQYYRIQQWRGDSDLWQLVIVNTCNYRSTWLFYL
jgi:hypothetical protein